jgi:hypothetical protein
VELFGFINLFGDFFPVVLGFLRQLPFVGPVLRGPVVGPVFFGKRFCADELDTRPVGWFTCLTCMSSFMSLEFMHRRNIPTCFLKDRDVWRGRSMWKLFKTDQSA